MSDMRTARVSINHSCNQNCRYCDRRRPRDDSDFVASSAVLGRLSASLSADLQELRLSGGEPTLHGQLATFVREVRARTKATLVLETNATLIDQARAHELADAGLDLAHVNVSGWGAGLDAVTRDPGGFEATRRGLLALREAGIPLVICVALARSTRELVGGVPRGLRELLGDDHGMRELQVLVPVAGPLEEELLDYGEAAPALLRLTREAHDQGLPVRLSPDDSTPPCIFRAGSLPSGIFSLTAGGGQRRGFRKLPDCEGCVLSDRCPGLADAYLARDPEPALHPILEERTRRQLSQIGSIDAQIEREVVTRNRLDPGAGGESFEDIVRTNFRCNQRCRFCFVSTHLPTAADARIVSAIEQAGRAGRKLTLSGGEPTLNPRLIDYVRLAKAHSTQPVQLQTNAVLLDDMTRARALCDAGLDEVFVSLHGCTPQVSDDVTGAPGTFARSVAGIDNLAKLDLLLMLNFVICRRNMAQLPDYVRFVATRWPQAFITISFVAPSTDLVPRDEDLIPRYTDVLPLLEEAATLAVQLGVQMGGLEAMCGLPLCLVPASLSRAHELTPIPEAFDQGEFIKTERCSGCALFERCYGLRRGYAALYGDQELRPISAGDSGGSR
ncbi:MAG: radical SAM protein [Deltaproteobacteria bacterium]|nr:radical SAM protein [Deltaproteobacteria bacterium]